jgi:hypothetical protein
VITSPSYLESISQQIVTATPGETITLTANYHIWAEAAQGEIKQAFFIASWTPSWPPSSAYYVPIYSGIPDLSPGVTGSTTFTITVPQSPGTYYLWWCGHSQYTMEEAVSYFTYNMDGLPAHVRIIVGDYAKLVRDYCPRLIFHESEQYFPTDFWHDDTDIDNNPRYYDSLTWPKTTYAHVVTGYVESKEYLAIEYWFYYVRDAKPPVGLPHDHDWESVYVFLERSGSEYVPSSITYFRHSGYVTHEWSSNEFAKTYGTHPVVHIALDSHASYEGSISIGARTLGNHFPYEPVDGGLVLEYDSYNVRYVQEAESRWPPNFPPLDPPWNRAGWYNPWGWMNPTLVSRSFAVVAASPVNLLVVDPEGLRTGYDPS